MQKKWTCLVILAAYLVLTLPMLVWAMEEKEPEVTSDFEVIHNGTGSGKIGITGEQKAEYDLQIKIPDCKRSEYHSEQSEEGFGSPTGSRAGCPWNVCRVGILWF